MGRGGREGREERKQREGKERERGSHRVNALKQKETATAHEARERIQVDLTPSDDRCGNLQTENATRHEMFEECEG